MENRTVHLARLGMTALAVSVALYSLRFWAVPAGIWIAIDDGIRSVIENVPVQALVDRASRRAFPVHARLACAPPAPASLDRPCLCGLLSDCGRIRACHRAFCLRRPGGGLGLRHSGGLVDRLDRNGLGHRQAAPVRGPSDMDAIQLCHDICRSDVAAADTPGRDVLRLHQLHRHVSVAGLYQLDSQCHRRGALQLVVEQIFRTGNSRRRSRCDRGIRLIRQIGFEIKSAARPIPLFCRRQRSLPCRPWSRW